MNIKKTADLVINFTINRLAEILGIIILISGALLLVALTSYSPEDPNFINSNNIEIKMIDLIKRLLSSIKCCIKGCLLSLSVSF